MGTSIHILTEIKKEGKWQAVPEIPKTAKERNYSTFAIFADIDNRFGEKPFPVRGLPDDISTRKYGFNSRWPGIENRYLNEEEQALVLPDGEAVSISSEDFRNRFSQLSCSLTAEEYEKVKDDSQRFYSPYRYSNPEVGERCFVYDAQKAGGIFKKVPWRDIYSTVEEFAAEYYNDEWDEAAQNYGSWDVDFEDEELYAHNYINLQELLDWDSKDYKMNKCKIPRSFYKAFTEAGGKLPEGFFVVPNKAPVSIADRFSEAFNPTVLVGWPMNEEKAKSLPIFKIIEELRQIASGYGINDAKDIRIIFAFGS